MEGRKYIPNAGANCLAAEGTRSIQTRMIDLYDQITRCHDQVTNLTGGGTEHKNPKTPATETPGIQETLTACHDSVQDLLSRLEKVVTEIGRL